MVLLCGKDGIHVLFAFCRAWVIILIRAQAIVDLGTLGNWSDSKTRQIVVLLDIVDHHSLSPAGLVIILALGDGHVIRSLGPRSRLRSPPSVDARIALRNNLSDLVTNTIKGLCN
ncbi:hypothetical protein BJX76DRAFT_244816 [Aspergillus varians]